MATDSARHTPPRTYWQVPTFLLGAAAVAALVVGRHAWRGDDQTQARRDTAAARAALDQPKPDAAAAVKAAQRALAALARLTPPDPQAAYDATQKQVDAQPSTDPRPSHAVRFRQADLLLKLGRGAEARPLLETIGADAPAELFYAARALLAQGYEEAQEWEKAARN